MTNEANKSNLRPVKSSAEYRAGNYSIPTREEVSGGKAKDPKKELVYAPVKERKYSRTPFPSRFVGGSGGRNRADYILVDAETKE